MKLSKRLFSATVLSLLVASAVSAAPSRPAPAQRTGVVLRPGPVPVPRPTPAPRRPVPAPIPRPLPAPIPAPGPQVGTVQQINIVLNHQSSGHSVLALKQLIQRQHPRLNLSQLKIRRVVLQAKSMLGNGTAALKIGQQTTYAETIPGSPQTYNLPGAQTFGRVSLQAPAFQHSGALIPWQIELRGNVKVRQLSVMLSR